MAEGAASLEVVTGGGFISGVGLGYREVEDRAFGSEPGQRVPRAAPASAGHQGPVGGKAGDVRHAVQQARRRQSPRDPVAWGQHKVLPGDDDMTQGFDDLLRDRLIVGDPPECAAEIQRCVDATGANTMVFRIHWPGMPHEAVVSALRLLAEQVRRRIRGRSARSAQPHQLRAGLT